MRAKLGAEIIGTFWLVLEPFWLFWVTPIVGALVRRIPLPHVH